LPYFPMYPTDFEAKTSHLSLEEDGAYNRLLRLMWMTPGCSLPDDNGWVMRRMRCDQATFDRVVTPVILEFMTRKGGRILSPRLLQEWQKADETYRLRSEAGKKGGRPQRVDNATEQEKAGLSQPKGGPKQPEPEPDIRKREGKPSLALVPKAARFDEFWAVYPHRGGTKRGRKPAEAKYLAAVKAGASEQDIIDGAKRAAMDRQVRAGFARDPTTWLNQEGWNDEIDTSRETQNGNGNYKIGNQTAESRDHFLDEIAIAARARPSQGGIGH